MKSFKRTTIMPRGSGTRATTWLSGAGTDLANVVIPVSFVVAATALCSLGGSVLHQVLLTALLNLVLVLAVYVFTGNSGIFSFGHAGFAIIGAYAAALAVIPRTQKQIILPNLPTVVAHLHLSTVPATIFGGIVAATAAAIYSLPAMRLRGLSASLATFAFLIIVYVVASNWYQLTNGTSGIADVPATTTVNSALVWSIIAIIIAYAFQRTRWCLRLRASREDEVAARSLGVSVEMQRRGAFIISGFIAGVAGALYGASLGSFTPDAFYLDLTFLTLAMLIVGGMTTLAGAVAGTAVLSTVAELLRRAENGFHVGPLHVGSRPGLDQVGLGVIMLVILLFRPQGLIANTELGTRIERALRRRRQEHPGAQTPTPDPAP